MNFKRAYKALLLQHTLLSPRITLPLQLQVRLLILSKNLLCLLSINLTTLVRFKVCQYNKQWLKFS